MEVVIVDSAAVAGALVADAVVAVVRRRSAPVIGVATGSSPQPVYDELAARSAAGSVSFARAHVVQLDEYVGLAGDDPRTYRNELRRVLLDRIDLPAGHFHGPDAWAEDLVAACAAYEAELAALGGVDLQLVGIGADGHVGFNEPGSSLGSRTRVKTLHARTVADNARFFEGEQHVPRHVVTQGIATVLDARHVVLLAFGAAKAHAVALAVEGPVSAFVPASALQLHPHVTVVVDEAAATGLVLADEYRATYAGKPAWQAW